MHQTSGSMRISQELRALLQLVVHVPTGMCGRGCKCLRVWLLGAKRVQCRVLCLRGGSAPGACACLFVLSDTDCILIDDAKNATPLAHWWALYLTFFSNSSVHMCGHVLGFYCSQGYLTDAGGLVQISAVPRYTSSSPLCAAAANGVVPRPVDLYVDTSFRLFKTSDCSME
jgi:hypothetical protein